RVDFATGMQVNTVAFNLYSAPDAGRASPRTLLNSTPISTPQSSSFTPILYTVQTGPIAGPYLYIEEIDRSDRRNLMGPFDVADERLRGRLERVEARLMAAGAAYVRNTLLLLPAQQGRWTGAVSPVPLRPVRRAAPTRAARIEVSRPGLVRVPIDELAAVGLFPRLAANPRGLSLTHLGREIPFTLLTGPAGPTAIEFQAKYLASAYAARNVYVLSWDRDRPRLAVSLTRQESPKAAGTIRLEANQIYVANAPRGSDPWLWDRLAPDEPFAAGFDLPGLPDDPGGEVAVQLRLATLTNHQVAAQAWVNGMPLRAGMMARPGEMTLRGYIPAAALLPTGNLLAVSFSAAGGDTEDPAVYLNFLDLGIALPSPTVPMAPDLVVPFDPSLPSLTGTNYLIVTHPLFLDQARFIAAQKAREGFRPVVVDVERAYDRFSAGVVEANAIRALISHWAGRQPGGRYVLLIGDDTFDPRNYYGMGEIPFLPSLTGWDDEFGRIPAENRYADLDDDGVPDIAIGRLPVQTPGQASVLADKIARQGSVLWQNAGRHLFAVDNQGPSDASFRAEADTVAAALPPASSVVWADLGADGIGPARAALLHALRQGVLATHYFGHAGPEVWADEQLLTLDDLEGLAQSYRETLLFSWACEAQFFQNIFGPSINEALLLVPGGGALASFGPAGITDPGLQRQLFDRVYRKFLSERLPLGEAIRQAKAAMIREIPGSRPLVEGWNLLGDPALRLPR
ncbi:MAG: C25 family cysteine peptidase, partial [Candidatus Methylomirabilota bacterium]